MDCRSAIDLPELESFEYTEILDEDQIRIIELYPGSESDMIRCNLSSEHRGNTRDTYTALSYAWGDPRKTELIICCSRGMYITGSLAGALRTIRSKKPQTSQRIWADAICINQECSEEKNHQVRQIGHVYEDASEVTVWLGPDDDNIAFDCFKLLRKWNVYLGEQLRIHGDTRNIPYFEPPQAISDHSKRGDMLRTFFELPWFSRVWVVQEAALAKECRLFWGDESMKFEEFMEFACFCNGRTDLKGMMGDKGLNLEMWRSIFRCVYCTYANKLTWRSNKPLIAALFKKNNPKEPGLFLDVLQVGKSLFASDARDHVYAFLGCPLALSGGNMLLLEPDYRQENTEAKVYLEMACALLKSRESPFVLCFVQHTSAEEVTGSNSPSWIPRWAMPAGPAPFFTIGNIGLGQKTGGPPSRLQYSIQCGDGGYGQLTLRGFEFDHVIWTSELLRSENFALNLGSWDGEQCAPQQPYIQALWQKVLIGFEKQGNGVMETLAPARFHDDFSLTLVSGYVNNRRIKSKEHKKTFAAYLKALDRVCNPECSTEIGILSKNELCNAYRYEMDTRNCSGRRLAVTRLGQLALVPRFTQAGDRCYVFLGMATPFIVRQAVYPKGASNLFHLVGEAYIRDVMRGELVNTLHNNDKEGVEINLT